MVSAAAGDQRRGQELADLRLHSRSRALQQQARAASPLANALDVMGKQFSFASLPKTFVSFQSSAERATARGTTDGHVSVTLTAYFESDRSTLG